METIADKLGLLLSTKAAIKKAIIGKGQPVTDSDPFSSYPDKIAAIETGIQLPALTNPGTAADLLAGKQLIDADGNVLLGSMPEVEPATPSISVNSAGLITASTNQATGYVPTGSQSVTKQLDTKEGATITPGTTDQTITAGKYLTGEQIIKGDANLVPENIKDGTSIFGVNGAYSGVDPILETASVYGTTTAGLITVTVKQPVKKVCSVTIQAYLDGGMGDVNHIIVFEGNLGFRVYEPGFTNDTGEVCIKHAMFLNGENLISISGKNITIGEQSLYWQAYVPAGTYLSCQIGYVPA